MLNYNLDRRTDGQTDTYWAILFLLFFPWNNFVTTCREIASPFDYLILFKFGNVNGNAKNTFKCIILTIVVALSNVLSIVYSIRPRYTLYQYPLNLYWYIYNSPLNNVMWQMVAITLSDDFGMHYLPTRTIQPCSVHTLGHMFQFYINTLIRTPEKRLYTLSECAILEIHSWHKLAHITI